MKRSRRLAALAWLAPTLLVLAWLHQGLLAGELFFKRDTLLVFLPLKTWLATAFAQGAFPEWWPFDGLGQPLASLPIASLFHPTTLLYAVLPLRVAFTLQTLVPLVLLPVGAWQLARTIGLKPPAAAFASAVVGVSFWNVLLAEQTQMHLAAASLPWFWREAIRLHRSRRGSTFVMALSTVNLVTGGDPMLLELAAVSLVPLLWRWPLRWRPLARVAVGLALGVLLGGVQVVPMAAAWFDSPRSLGGWVGPADPWAVDWAALRATLVPAHFGTDLLFDTLYVGAPTVALALAGLRTRARLRWRLLLILLLLVVTSFGYHGGLWRFWSVVLPGWSGLRYPVKALGPAVLPLALLAGHGLQSVAGRGWVWLAAGASGAVLLALGVWSAAFQVITALMGFLLGLRPQLARPLAWGIATSVALEVGLQLGVAPTWPFEQVEAAPPLAQALSRLGVSLEGSTYDWTYRVPMTLERRLPDWRQVQTEIQVLTLAPSTGALYGLPTAKPYMAGVTKRVFMLRRSPDWDSRLAPLFGVGARLEAYPGELPPTEAVAADHELGAAVVPIPNARPRAYVAFDIRPVDVVYQVSALSRVAGSNAVIVDPGVPATPPAEAQALRPVTLHRDVDSLRASVDLDAPGLLVINEAYAPGWRATVNGAAARVLVANHAVLGLDLPAGRSEVRLEYSTPGLEVGAVVSVMAAVLLAALSRRRVAVG